MLYHLEHTLYRSSVSQIVKTDRFDIKKLEKCVARCSRSVLKVYKKCSKSVIAVEVF